MDQPIRLAKAILIMLLCPLLSMAQRQLQYKLQVNASLSAQTFSVKGSLSFLTGSAATDSVVMTIGKTTAPPLIQLNTKGIRVVRIDTAAGSYGDTRYHIKFAKPVPPATRLEFACQYERGAARAFQYFIDSTFCMAGGYGSAWYPQIASGDGSTKHLRGAGTITVTVPEPLSAVMAASVSKVTTKGQSRTFTFRYDTPDIFSLYIARYTRQEVKGPVPFYCFTLNREIDAAALSLRASAVLDHLVSLFGPLSIPNFSIIEFPDAVSEQTGIGGASLMGGILMPSNALKRFNYALFGHELSHQWWGNKVLAKGSRGAEMLSEGLAQYGALQAVAAFDSSRAILFRKTGYPGYLPDQSGFGYLKNAAAGIDAPLAELSHENGHTIGDSKGFLVLELLSNTMTKPVFHKALRTIGDKYSQTGITWSEFLQELETAHGSSLQWFYEQWFNRKGAPAWETAWRQQQNELLLTLTQTDSIYRLPLEIEITYANGEKAIRQIELTEREGGFRLPVTGRVTALKTDPGFKVLHWEEELAPKARAMSKVQRVQQLRIEQKPAEAEQLAQAYLKEGFPDDRYGVEFSLLYALARLKLAQGKEEEALGYFQRALQCATRAPELLAYTYYRIAQIARRKKDNALFEWARAHAIKADSLNNGKDDMKAMLSQL